MNHDRHEINTDNIREAGQPNMIKDLLRGLIADTRGMFEGRRMRREARTAKEKGIADEAYRQRMAAAQEKQVAIAGQRADLEGTKYEDQKEAAAKAAQLEEEKRKLDEQNRNDYVKAFDSYQKVYTAWLKDPSEENTQMLKSAVQNFQYHSTLFTGDKAEFPDSILSDIESQQATEEKEKGEANLKTETDAFNEAYSSFNKLTPADEGYADAHTKLLRSAGALNRTQETLKIDDPLVDGILKNPENMGKVEKLSALEELRPEATRKFWEEYQNFVTDPDATLQNVEQRGAEVINLLTQLGEQGNITTYTNILDNLRQQNSERIKAKRKAEDDKNERLDATNIEEYKTMLNSADWIEENERQFVFDALDSGIFQTREDVKKHLDSLQTLKARAQYTGTDTARSQNQLDKYDPEGANYKLVNAVAAKQSKDKREYSINYLTDVFEGKEFDELTDSQKDAAVTYFLQNDTAPGGEIVTRLMESMKTLQRGIASLYQEFERVTTDGEKVKNKLGRIEALSEGAWRYVAGDTTDPDIAAFESKAGLLLTTYIRLVSGAQVTTWEHTNFKGMLPGAGKSIELNEALFKALDADVRGFLEAYYNGRVGRKWSSVASDKVYHGAHDVAESITKKTDSRIDGGGEPTPKETRQETRLKTAISHLKGIDESGNEVEKLTREQLKTYLIEVGISEEDAESLLNDAQEAIAAEGL